MALKPWHKVVTPREDLLEGKLLDAAEFAVHLGMDGPPRPIRIRSNSSNGGI